jgi:hypothetical protein
MRLLLTYLLIFSVALAQNSYFEAKVDKNEYTTDDFITLKVSSDYEGNYQDPTFTGLRILSEYKSESVQQNSAVINGKRQLKLVRQFTTTYVLKATKEGEVKIGSALIQKGSDVFTTKPIILDIKPGTMPLDGSLDINPETPLTLRVYADTNQVFVGQPFKVIVKAYSKNQMIRVRNLQKPANYTQHATSVLPSLNAELDVEYIDGVRMYSVVLSEDVLVYNTPGDYTWNPFEIRMVLRKEPYGIDYENAFSNTVDIKVLDLPSPPANFSGIGGFEMKDSVWIDNEIVGDEEDGFEISVKISGAGSIHNLQAPKLIVPNYLDVYAPETEDNVKASPLGSEGHKTFKYYVLPEANGEFKFQPLDLSYFDYKLGGYINFKGKELDIKVNKSGLPELKDLKEKELEKQISSKGKPIAKRTNFNKSSYAFPKAIWQSLGLGFLGLGFVFFLFPRRKAKEKASDDLVFNPGVASKVAQEFLLEAEENISGESNTFFDKLNKGVYHYFQQKWEWELSKVNKSAILQKLTDEDIDTELIDEVKKLLDQAQMGMYSPIETNKATLLNAAKAVLEKLEMNLKK